MNVFLFGRKKAFLPNKKSPMRGQLKIIRAWGAYHAVPPSLPDTALLRAVRRSATCHVKATHCDDNGITVPY